MESVWLLIVLFVFIILIFPMFFRLYFFYSPLKNSGMIIMKLWFITITYLSFQLKTNSIIIRSKKERIQIEYQYEDPKLKFYEYFYLQLRHKLKLKYLDIYSEIGTGDAFHSAMLSAVMNIIYKIIGSYIKNAKFSSSIVVNTKTEFNKPAFSISIFSKASISIFDIIYCLFITLFYEDKKITYKNTIKNR